jgi:Ca2+-binding EF-hand superfamily protein
MDKIYWIWLSMNPNAIHLFGSLDFEKTKEANEAFRMELIERVFDPDRLGRISKGSLREYLEIIG